MSKKKPVVSIVMGSDSDWSVMQPASEILKQFGVSHECQVISAHRTAQAMQKYALKAQTRGIKIIIAGAGGSAHLPGMISSLTTLPVIGVPVCSTKLKGLDSLLSIVQMPKGIPVATVAVDNAYNAALLAMRMLSISQAGIKNKLKQYMKKQQKKTMEADKNVKRLHSQIKKQLT